VEEQPCGVEIEYRLGIFGKSELALEIISVREAMDSGEQISGNSQRRHKDAWL